MQLEGFDFLETHAPVVQWTTIRLMFILEVLLGLKSKQGDVTCAFLHADLEPDETVYVAMPLGFNTKSKNGKRQVLKLNKLFMDFVRVPGHFGNISPKSWRVVGLSNPGLIHVFSLDLMLCALFMLTT
jgi:hypothetical protein